VSFIKNSSLSIPRPSSQLTALTNLHTYDNEGDTKPFMFAFNFYATNPQISRSDRSFTINAYADTISGLDYINYFSDGNTLIG
jgi:hypothetical protein